MSIEFLKVASMGEISDGSALEVEVGDLLLVLFGVDGQVFATDAYCTHGHAQLAEGYVTGNVVECPMHGGCFDIKTGEAVGPPCVDALRTYPTKVEEGSVFVGIDLGAD